MPSLLPRSKKLRTALLVLVSIVIIGIAASLLANTADSGSGSKHQSNGSSTVAPPKHVAALKLRIGTVSIQNTGPPAKIKAPVRRAVLDATQGYVDDAILAPLERGHVDTGYESMFDSGVKSAAAGPDRPALTEGSTGVARGAVHATASPLRVDGIGDQSGKIALVAASFGLTVKASTPAGPLTITRLTELTFANEFGKWRVTAYKVIVRRRIGATTTSKRASTGDPTGVAQ
jgi:hypothetical protein